MVIFNKKEKLVMMYMKLFFMILLSFLIATGCQDKKADEAKSSEKEKKIYIKC